MKHLELHIIQSVPVSCLNRDDLNSPKTAVFGGVQRARVSSQSWKRAIREMAKELQPELFKGNRTRRMVYTLTKRLVKKGFSEDTAIALCEQIADIIETLDSKKDEDGYKKIKTVMFFSEAEYDSIAKTITESNEVKKAINELNAALAIEDEKQKNKEKKKALKPINKIVSKAIRDMQLKDAADIALFGRMVANDPSLKVDGATMFSHALSVHKVENEIDFFTAVDDLQKDDHGAGITSTLEFNSATYYRFAALNLDMLVSSANLGALKKEERQDVVKAFIEATIKAIPGARRNSMNGNTMPNYVLGIVRDKGHPTQLINAFENPIKTNQGYIEKAIELLKMEHAKLKEIWGIKSIFEEDIPHIGFDDFLKGLAAYVE